MRILVTGGTGFIGGHLCLQLLADGHAVTVLSRSPASVPARCGVGVGALASLADWHPSLHFDAVINLAGAPIADAAWTPARRRELHDSRVALTRELVATMLRATRRPAVLLSGSAIGLYGDAGDRALDEQAPVAGDFAAQLCVDWEAVTRPAAQAGIRVCLLRTGLVLDPSGGMLAKLLPSFRLGGGARLGEGRQWMSWISLGDYLAAVAMLLENETAAGPFNLTAPTPVTNAVFTATLARALRRPAVLAVPAALLKLVLGARAPLLLASQRVLPARLQAQGFVFRDVALAPALAAMLAPA